MAVKLTPNRNRLRFYGGEASGLINHIKIYFDKEKNLIGFAFAQKDGYTLSGGTINVNKDITDLFPPNFILLTLNHEGIWVGRLDASDNRPGKD